jgi:four helix bundle protein
LRDQLDRASVSIVLNIAEGAGRTTGPDKAHFFAIARGSATESAAVMDLLLARGLVDPAEHRHARGLVVRIVQMTTGLIAGTPPSVKRAAEVRRLEGLSRYPASVGGVATSCDSLAWSGALTPSGHSLQGYLDYTGLSDQCWTDVKRTILHRADSHEPGHADRGGSLQLAFVSGRS